MTYTAADKLACIERKLRQRRRVYARLVAQERMSEAKADMEIGCMESIRDDYKALADAQEAAGDLFARSPETGKIG